MTAEEIAAGLSATEKAAMLANHWSARSVGKLFRLGLVYWSTGPHGRPMIKFRPLGQVVRAILESNHDRA